MDPERFVFIDETGTATNMARRYGRSRLGERLVAAVPHGHWRTTTFVAGLRQSGVIAPLVLDGPMTGPAFRAYVEQFLAPALAPGDVVVLDNLAAHKVRGVRQALAAAGASILYLPPYSADLNRSRAAVRQAEVAPTQGRRAHQGRTLATSAASSPPSRQPNAPAISTTATMVLTKVKMLQSRKGKHPGNPKAAIDAPAAGPAPEAVRRAQVPR
jgi:DDE superfamily endonuclease